MLVQQRISAAKPHLAPGRARTSRVCVRASRGPVPGKQLDRSSTVQLSATHEYNANAPLVAQTGKDLTQYMDVLGKDFSRVKMPLGAELKKMEERYQILAPRIQLFDQWIQPKSLSDLDFGPNFIGLQARECILDGSESVRKLKLQDAFNLYVQLRFTWDDGKQGGPPRIFSKATIDVDVALPFPFSALPRPLVETTGNTAFKATLSLMLDSYMQSLLRDYEAWAKKPSSQAANV